MTDVKHVLESIGYRLYDRGRNFSACPLYRESDSKNALQIDKKTGQWYDFSLGKGGGLTSLIRISSKESDPSKIQKILDGITEEKQHKEIKIKFNNSLPRAFLDDIVKNHSYWNGRGISSETMDIFEGGIMQSGGLKNRYVFPIFNSVGKLIGLSGRATSANPKIKWKHKGAKSDWLYPLKYNSKFIHKANKVILVESIGDMLSLWEAGVRNTVVTFGLDINKSIINLFLRNDFKRVYICFNNDENHAGQNAARKAKDKITKHFSSKFSQIVPPTKNDFGDMGREEIIQWVNKLND